MRVLRAGVRALCPLDRPRPATSARRRRVRGQRSDRLHGLQHGEGVTAALAISRGEPRCTAELLFLCAVCMTKAYRSGGRGACAPGRGVASPDFVEGVRRAARLRGQCRRESGLKGSSYAVAPGRAAVQPDRQDCGLRPARSGWLGAGTRSSGETFAHGCSGPAIGSARAPLGDGLAFFVRHVNERSRIR